MQTAQGKNILIAPLDWGLGHTTRCLPIVRYLQQLGHHPIVAGNERQRAFVQQSLPGITTIDLPGYDIRYSRANTMLQAGILSQLPRIARTIKREHEWLKGIVTRHQIHGIISDNRYGLYHDSVPAVIITHQPQVITGAGALADGIARRLHYQLLSHFNSVWIADAPGAPNLAGQLSHPAILPARAEYIGLLSRYAENRNRNSADEQLSNSAGEHLLILLSGPEPLRGELSALLRQQAISHTSKVVFVEGRADAPQPANMPHHITWHPTLAGDALQQAIIEAHTVVCRSGYSTIMDLVALGKKAILIPTPGQTEQLYLGNSLHEQAMFYCAPQRGFDLQQALTAAASFAFRTPGMTQEFRRFEPIVDKWLTTL